MQLLLRRPVFLALQAGDSAALKHLLEAGCSLDFLAPRPVFPFEYRVNPQARQALESLMLPEIPDGKLTLLEVWDVWKREVFAKCDHDPDLQKGYQECDELLRTASIGVFASEFQSVRSISSFRYSSAVGGGV